MLRRWRVLLETEDAFINNIVLDIEIDVYDNYEI